MSKDAVEKSGTDESAAKSIYMSLRPGAEVVKVLAQMFIGVVIFVALVVKAFLYFSSPDVGTFLATVKEMAPLTLVATGLAISAGVELCYMLFTPGPDEAIEPLILGLSSTTLLVISKSSAFSWNSSLAVAVFTVAIVALFWTRKRLL